MDNRDGIVIVGGGCLLHVGVDPPAGSAVKILIAAAGGVQFGQLGLGCPQRHQEGGVRGAVAVPDKALGFVRQVSLDMPQHHIAGAEHVDGTLGVIDVQGVAIVACIGGAGYIVGGALVVIPLNLEYILHGQLLLRHHVQREAVGLGVQVQAGSHQVKGAPFAAGGVLAVVGGIQLGRGEGHVGILTPQAVVDGEGFEGLGVQVVLAVLKVNLAYAGAVGRHKEGVLRQPHGAPEIAAVNLKHPGFIAVHDVDGFAGILPAVLVNQVAHHFHSLPGGGGALQGDVLGVPAVHQVVPGKNEGRNLFPVLRIPVHREGGFAHGHALIVDEGVAGVEILVGVFRLGDFLDGKAVAIVLGVGIVAVIAIVMGIDHQVAGLALAAFHGRDNPQAEVCRGRVVVVGGDG